LETAGGFSINHGTYTSNDHLASCMAAGCWLWRVGAAAAPIRKRQLAAAEDELTKLSDEIESHGGDNAGTVELQTLEVGDY
jgi:hypothetical protein